MIPRLKSTQSQVSPINSPERIETDKRENDCADIRYVIHPDSPYACDRPGARTVSDWLTIQKGEIRQVLYPFFYAQKLI